MRQRQVLQDEEAIATAVVAVGEEVARADAVGEMNDARNLHKN